MTEQTIFLAALECSGPERASYLDQACAGNEKLRHQVESLLLAHERSGEFLDRPAVEQIAAQAPATDQSTRTYTADANSTPGDRTVVNTDSTTSEALGFLQPSTRPGSIGRLDHYEILERIGVGASLRRSWRLAVPDWWRVWGIRALSAIIATVLAWIVMIPLATVSLAVAVHRNDLGLVPISLLLLGGIVAGTITAPFTSGVLSLLYIDRRMRAEGLDVTLAQAAAQQAPRF